MTDEIRELKKQRWAVKQEIEKAEKHVAEYAEQVTNAQKLLEGEPNNADIRDVLTELEEELGRAELALEPLLEQLAALEAQLPAKSEPAAPKFDPEKHPLLRKTLEKAEPAKEVTFNTGDICEAQWTDKNWYKAKIQTILGAASAPKYHVRFLEYDDTMTVDRNSIRPLQSKRKRDPEPAPVPAAAPAPQATSVTSTPHVISGPVSVNPNASTATGAPAENPEPKKRKIPNQKALEKGVNSWKNWNSKGVGKKISQKESMFRSGTTVNSRVGFTGSGAGMTETNKRIRHNNKAEADADEQSGGFGKKSRF